MNGMQALSVFIVVALLAIGQVLLKVAAQKLDVVGKGLMWAVLSNPMLMIALVIYGVATVGWVWVLRDIPLRLAYPFVALAFVIVPVLAFFVLDEPLKLTSVLGALLIVAGIVVATR